MFSLPANEAMELAAILEIDANSNPFTHMKAEVEKMIGCYPGMVDTLDNAPTDAAKAAAIKPLLKLANKLRQGLNDLDSASISALDDTYRVELINELCWFCGRAKNVCEELETTESRGAPKRCAHRIVINQFCDIYMRYAVNPNEDGRLNFVTAILDTANIPYEDNDSRLLENQPRM